MLIVLDTRLLSLWYGKKLKDKLSYVELTQTQRSHYAAT